MKLLRPALLVLLSVLPLGAACGADGESAKECGDLPVYDVRVDGGGLSEADRARLREAERKGCVTGAGTAVTQIGSSASR